MTVLLEPDVVNDILSIDPSQQIKVRFGHYDDDSGTGSDTIPSNFQPLGKSNSNALDEFDPNDGFEGSYNYNLTTTNSTFSVSDFNVGAGNGSDTVYYTISGNPGTPIVETPHTSLIITPNAPDSSGNGSITIESDMACSPIALGLTGQSFTIRHPNSSSTSLTYTGNITPEQCPVVQTRTHTFTNLNLYVGGGGSYTDSGGNQQSFILAGGAQRSFCAEVGSTSTYPPGQITTSIGNTICY
jgi:hypothetical protein